MFKRVEYEDWVVLIGIVSFVLVAAGFVIGVIRAFCIPKQKREHLASLPLDSTSPQPDASHDAPPPPPKP